MKFEIALAQSQSGYKKFARLGKSSPVPAGRAFGRAHPPYSPLHGPKAASKFRTARLGPECVMGEVDACYLVRRVTET
jgi:hypothetical protein